MIIHHALIRLGINLEPLISRILAKSKWLIFSLLALVLSAPCISADDTVHPAPSCQLQSFDRSSRVDLQHYKGQVIYLDFWASWCGPCAESFPFMNRLHNSLKGDGLVLLAVNLDEDVSDAKNFLTAHAADFTLVSDPDQQCAKQFAVKAMPSSYLIDRKGQIREVHLGFRPGEAESFEAKVKQLLAETP